MDSDSVQQQEWRDLYIDLRAMLASHGIEDPFGDADYWLVDDNYGSQQHKVCVTRVSFITRPLCREAQRLIRRYSLSWEILFSLENRVNEDDLGVTVTQSRIDEHWNARRMADQYGTDFRWNLSSSPS
jgi:hypothetical protein